MDLLSAHIGSRVDIGGVQRTVVGRVENPRDLSDAFALIAPKRHAKTDSLTLLFDEGAAADRDAGPSTATSHVDFAVMARGSAGPISALLLVAVVLGLSLVGLLVAAGFVVVAQRRQRQLGLLAAVGATGRQLRLVMATTGG